MAHYRELSDPTMLAPEEAFKMLGNETRIEILRVLGYLTHHSRFRNCTT